MEGWARKACNTFVENLILSTASALPAGTDVSSAHCKRGLLHRKSSFFKSAWADGSPFDFSELEHTSSAGRPVLCAGVVVLRTHFKKLNPYAVPCQNKRRLASRKTGADDPDRR